MRRNPFDATLILLAVIVAVGSPQEPSYDVYVVTSAQVDSVNRWPSQAMLPKQYGFEEVKFEGDFGDRVFQPLQPAVFRFDGCKFGQLRLVNLASPRVINGDIGSIQVDNSDDCTIDGARLGNRLNQVAHGIRIRKGSDRATIRNCLIVRAGAGGDGDCHGIVLTEGPNVNCVIEDCQFGGCWTDAIQVCHTNFQTFGEAPGLRIRRCEFTTDQTLIADGRFPDYIEQSSGIDFKTGATESSPGIVEDCTFIGGGQSARNPNGYQIVVQNQTTDILFRRNKFFFRGCNSALALGPPRLNDGAPMFNRRTRFEDNQWTTDGTLIMFTDTATFTREKIYCGKLEDKPVASYREPRQFIDCLIVENPQ